jgi:ATP-dependent exoDNAse (exonuclease V) beta subunit
VPFNKAIQSYGEKGKNLYNKLRHQQELDNTNILYVALTRAIEELHIISKYPKKKSINSHNEMFRSFLESEEIWEENRLLYFWGKENKNKIKPELPSRGLSSLYNRQVYTKKAKIEFQNQQILFGKTLHELMSKIHYSYQLDKEILEFRESKKIKGINKEEIIQLAKKIIAHPSLKKLFDTKNTVICEKEIFVNKTRTIRPDRITIIEPKKCVIVDYKSGDRRAKDMNQVKEYSQILEQMGYKVQKALIVYFLPALEVEEVR